jgi:hypothetical protein
MASLLMLLSAFGVVWSARVAAAQVLYHHAKFTPAAGDADGVLSYCAGAWRLYPFNYRFCELAAHVAYYAAGPGTADERSRMSRMWCLRGLGLNRHPRPMRWLMTQFLWRESPVRAIAYWKEYVDWDFWSPYAHAVLAEMHARTGDFDEAEREVYWTRRSEFFGPTTATIDAERRKRQPAE